MRLRLIGSGFVPWLYLISTALSPNPKYRLAKFVQVCNLQYYPSLSPYPVSHLIGHRNRICTFSSIFRTSPCWLTFCKIQASRLLSRGLTCISASSKLKFCRARDREYPASCSYTSLLNPLISSPISQIKPSIFSRHPNISLPPTRISASLTKRTKAGIIICSSLRIAFTLRSHASETIFPKLAAFS
jgi:hypothetical protein